VDCGVDINILSDRLLRDALQLGVSFPSVTPPFVNRKELRPSAVVSRTASHLEDPHWHFEWRPVIRFAPRPGAGSGDDSGGP
jgi:hypothetical protein